jgi:uncharacterized protein (DUF1501 family)
MKRRSFFKASAAAGTVLPLTLNGMGVKAFEDSPLLRSLGRRSADGKVLVIINLSGGNDGLNTLIPIDQYSNLSKARNNILIPQDKVLPFWDKPSAGLHPKLSGLRDLYNNGMLSAVQAVGYPNPNYSHFRATDIWMSGSDSNESWTTGWMGRYLDGQYTGYPKGYPTTNMPDPLAIQIGQMVSLTFMGPEVNMGMAITDPTTFYNLANGTTDPTPSTPAGNELAFLRLMAQQTNQYATVIKNAAAKGTNKSSKYPTGGGRQPLSDQLKIVAKLISGGLKTPVYMVSIGGFDTHSEQVDSTDHSIGAHATLMQQLGDAIAAFQDDIKLLGLEDRVVGMTFSEFGRRVMSNASNGTDHGAAAPLFVFGKAVQNGVIGANPTIPSTVTVNDNLPMQFDFRQVYASVLTDWFELPAAEVKAAMGGKEFNTLPIFKANKASIEDYVDLVSRIALNQIYPNPATQSTQISYFTESGHLKLSVFDATGQLIKVIKDEWHGHGTYVVDFEVDGLRPGNYYVQLSQGEKRITEVLLVQ